MAKIELQKMRSRIMETAQGLEVVIPTRKNIFVMLFLPIWLCGWVFGEVSVIHTLLAGGDQARAGNQLFLMVWLCGWTVGGGFAGFAWLWTVMGQEVVRVSSIELQTVRRIGRFSRSKEYDMANVKKLRVSPSAGLAFWGMRSADPWGLKGGSIAFDYGPRTYQFGGGIDEAEAEQLVQTIRQRFRLQ